MNSTEETKIERAAFKIILFAAIAVFTVWITYELRIVLVAVLMSITLAGAIAPLAELAEKRKIPRMVTVLLVYAVIGIIYALVAVALMPALKEQALNLYDSLPIYISGLVDRYPMLGEYIGGANGHDMKIDSEQIRAIVPSVVRRTLSLTAGLLGAVVNVILVLFLTTYFVVEADGIWKNLLMWVPLERRQRLGELIRPLGMRMGGYIRGQLMVSIAVATIVGTGLTVLGVQYSLVLGALAGLFNLIPFVGSMITMVLSLLVAINQSPTLALFVLLLFGIEQWAESNFIVPHLLGRQVDLHPLIVLFAILIGATLMGLPGALVAVPVTAALLYILQEFYVKPLNKIDTPPTEPPEPEQVPANA